MTDRRPTRRPKTNSKLKSRSIALIGYSRDLVVAQFKKGDPKRGGRVKGTPNRTTVELKAAILEAATKAGGKGKLVGYLTRMALEQPAAFMTLLGKVLPLQVSGESGGPITVEIVRFADPLPDEQADPSWRPGK